MARISVSSRKEQILQTAIQMFAELGYYKTTTAMIAQSAGVTQPYLFHFYKTKQELYLAVLEIGVTKIYQAFEQVQTTPDQLLVQMGQSFEQLIANHRNEMLLTMFSFVTAEPPIRAFAKENHLKIYHLILNKLMQANISNASAEAKKFIGVGLMCSLSQLLEAPELSP
jgi:AcrR family transcriptional regulator